MRHSLFEKEQGEHFAPRSFAFFGPRNLLIFKLSARRVTPVWDGQEIAWTVLGLTSIVYLIGLAVGFLRGRKKSLMLSAVEGSGW